MGVEGEYHNKLELVNSSVNKKYRGGRGWVLGEEEGERERHLGKKEIRQHFP